MNKYKHKTILVVLLLSMLFVNKLKAASFEFVPSSYNFDSCNQQVDIYIDPEGAGINAADVEIFYDPTKVGLTDADTNLAGKQILTGAAFQNYWSNIVDEDSKKVLLAGGNYTNNNAGLTTKQRFATISFLAKNIYAGEKIKFTLRFDGVGETLDSNIADLNDGHDLLTSVVNGVYIFNTSCDENGKEITYTYTTLPVSSPVSSTISYTTLEETRVPDEGAVIESTNRKDISYELYEYTSVFCLCLLCPAILSLIIILSKRKNRIRTIEVAEKF